jgi:hypothetical protein
METKGPNGNGHGNELETKRRYWKRSADIGNEVETKPETDGNETAQKQPQKRPSRFHVLTARFRPITTTATTTTATDSRESSPLANPSGNLRHLRHPVCQIWKKRRSGAPSADHHHGHG